MGGHGEETSERRNDVKALIYGIGAVALVLILLGVVLKAVKWLIIIGLVALVAAIVLGVVKGRRTLR